MTTRRVITALSVLGLCIALGIWLFQPKETVRTTEVSTDQSDGNLVSATPETPATSESAKPSVVKRPDVQSSALEVQKRFNEDWKKPISFYGKVVDEQGEPIQGANVSFIWNDLSPKGTSEASSVSDTNGRFSLTGVTGRGVMIKIDKTGYYLQRRGAQFYFDYAREHERFYHRGDPNNPVVFTLKKMGHGTDLITSAHGVKTKLAVAAPLDGQTVFVDLLNRKVGRTGVLEISQVKPEYKEWKKATEWSFRMSIPDGGFSEHTDEFAFEAPESGYKPTVEFHLRAGETNWTNLRKEYYIAFGQPRRYGRMKLETAITMSGARLEYAINPDGSRYLEPKDKTFRYPSEFYEPGVQLFDQEGKPVTLPPLEENSVP